MEIPMQNRSFPYAAALVSACLLFSCGGAPTTSVPEAAQASAVQAPAPAPDFALPDAQGNEIKLSDLKGKVVLLNFWATWCAPCKIEMPWFVEFQRDYKDRGFAVVAVSLDEEGWEVVKPFAESLKLNFPVVVGDDELADKFGGIAALPTTFIINREGKIITQHTGLVSKGDYKDEIESLL
jgi:peroxiredoxin